MKWENSAVEKISWCILLLLLLSIRGFILRVILHCQSCSMRMELLTDSDNLVIKPFRAFQIPRKEQFPSLLGILNHKSDFIQLMKNIFPLVYKMKHSWPPCGLLYFLFALWYSALMASEVFFSWSTELITFNNNSQKVECIWKSDIL